MELQNLLVEFTGHTAIIKINRAYKLNALNTLTLKELRETIASLQGKDDVYSIIITGVGDKAFAAGADISELNKLTKESGFEYASSGQKTFAAVEESKKPVIAAVNGYALGGGCELALACHFRTASENAVFGQPEINLGLIPGFGGTQRLTRIINPGRALEYILTGEMIKADEALRIGLISKIFPHNQLMQKTLELAEKINSKGAASVSYSIEAVMSAYKQPHDKGYEVEARLFAECCATEDFKEGTAAFLEKRSPQFKR